MDLTAAYQQLSRTLPKEGARAKSARVKLDYWYNDWATFLREVVRKSVTTKDGKPAELVFLKAPAITIPGCDFSMAFLLVENRAIDWASCYTCNWSVHQELMLEDVDGDGALDVAFRATEGCRYPLEKGFHSWPGDERKWLYAYAITSRGFDSLFPNTDRELSLNHAYDPDGHPVTLRVEGLPKTLREYQMVEGTISATNASKQNLPIKRGEWFHMDVESANYLMTYGPGDDREVLKPGETVSRTVRFFLSGKGEVTMRWKFTPSGWNLDDR